MAKQLLYSEAARAAILRGVNQLADDTYDELLGKLAARSFVNVQCCPAQRPAIP